MPDAEAMCWDFREKKWGDAYSIECRWDDSVSAYRLYCIAHPPSRVYPLGHPAHLLEGDEICVELNRRPTTIDGAKAVAMVWLIGFSTYIRSGVFPNGPTRTHVNGTPSGG